ncbi:hypothetical protein KKB99_08570, partial [bacterium]|nr:hypothetical protein [bacterium]MBU1026044.1 hypothetical protein [bacterium]
MLSPKLYYRLSVCVLAFSLSIGCSGKSDPIVLPPPENLIDQSEPYFPQEEINRDIRTSPPGGTHENYIEKTGPLELLNPNLILPWTLNTRPTLTGTLHTTETVPVKKVGASINFEFDPNVTLNGDQVTFTPSNELKYGKNHIYIAVVFENDFVACAYWDFEVREKPPQISGFLGDEAGRKYFLCFDRELDRKRVENIANWKLNDNSDLIDSVQYMNFGDWVMVQLVDKYTKETFRDQDYQISYDTGNGTTQRLLIPKGNQAGSGGGRDGGCGEIVHLPKDVHYSVESENHAITYVVLTEPGCNLEVEWNL